MKKASWLLLLTVSGSSNAMNATPVTDALHRCAAPEHVKTLRKVIRHESGDNPYNIGVNSDRLKLKRPPQTLEEAVGVAGWLERHGYSFDVGYGQINSANLKKFGYTGKRLEQAFEPCENISLASRIYQDCFDRGGSVGAALSCYNTGSFSDGFSNGYVSKVLTVKVDRAMPSNDEGRPDLLVPKDSKPKIEKKVPETKKGAKPQRKAGGEEDVFSTNGDEDVFACKTDDQSGECVE